MPEIKERKTTRTRTGRILDKNIDKLAVYFERSEFQDYLELLGNPKRLLWVNFMAGLARGVGMFLGGGLIGTVVLAIVIAVLAWGVHALGGLPWIGAEFQKLVLHVRDIVLQHQK